MDVATIPWPSPLLLVDVMIVIAMEWSINIHWRSIPSPIEDIQGIIASLARHGVAVIAMVVVAYQYGTSVTVASNACQ